jgi:hypothetical protein
MYDIDLDPLPAAYELSGNGMIAGHSTIHVVEGDSNHVGLSLLFKTAHFFSQLFWVEFPLFPVH